MENKITAAPLPYLPETILEEIFHNLSLEDMARSKVVCSTWNFILSSPKFIDDYYNKRRTEGNSRLIFFLNEHYMREKKRSGHLVRVGSSSLSMQPSEDHKEWGFTGEITFVGTYNGLVAIECDGNLILWNPLTKKHSSVCLKGYDFYYDFINFNYHDLIVCGLCYDINKDRYSVVAAWDADHQGVVDVSLYSFEKGTERMVDSQFIEDEYDFITCCIGRGKVGKVIRGLPHWAVKDEMKAKMKIFYFDLEEDDFKDIAPPPDAGSTKILLELTTTVGEDQLGCVLHDKVDSSLEVWVMKEYGNAKSWTNLIKAQYSMEFPSLGYESPRYLLSSVLSGEVLICWVLSCEVVNEKVYYAYRVGNGELTEINKLQDDDELNLGSLYTCHHKLTSPPKSTKDEGKN